jgi:hypothetical protein
MNLRIHSAYRTRCYRFPFARVIERMRGWRKRPSRRDGRPSMGPPRACLRLGHSFAAKWCGRSPRESKSRPRGNFKAETGDMAGYLRGSRAHGNRFCAGLKVLRGQMEDATLSTSLNFGQCQTPVAFPSRFSRRSSDRNSIDDLHPHGVRTCCPRLSTVWATSNLRSSRGRFSLWQSRFRPPIYMSRQRPGNRKHYSPKQSFCRHSSESSFQWMDAPESSFSHPARSVLTSHPFDAFSQIRTFPVINLSCSLSGCWAVPPWSSCSFDSH